MNYATRIDRIRESVFHSKISAVIVTEEKNRRYLCGFEGSAGWLVITENKHTLFTDGRYWEQASQQCPGIELFRYVPSKHGTLSDAVVTMLQEMELQDTTVGLETDGLSLSNYREISQALQGANIGLQEIEGATLSLRACKDQSELDCLSKAAQIADKALAVTLKTFQPGMRECDLKADLEHNILKQGGSSTSFSTIIASGPNGSFPHAGASERIVEVGELITIDFGAIYRGYCSDMTRTIWFGELPENLRHILHHTRAAQAAAVSMVAEGVAAADLDKKAREILKAAKLDEYFVHSLGHGVGLNIHEPPTLRTTNPEELRAGQVITIEPGGYIPGLSGCRVEDTVVVTTEGCTVLNKFPKQDLDAQAPATELLV